jgi:hypothetical protein
MSTFNVSTILDIDSFFENLAHNSCCDASNFVKKVAKAATVLDSGEKVRYLEQLVDAPDGQLAVHWRDKAKELLKES